jgi:hypothetical protein
MGMVSDVVVNFVDTLYVLWQIAPVPSDSESLREYHDSSSMKTIIIPIDLSAYKTIRTIATAMIMITAAYTKFWSLPMWRASTKMWYCGDRTSSGTTDLRVLFWLSSVLWVLMLAIFVLS